MNGCAPGLALTERLKATRKWAIIFVRQSNLQSLTVILFVCLVHHKSGRKITETFVTEFYH